MAFSGFSFIFWRIMEILTLIPTMGMLAWFVHIYDHANLRTPTAILVLFIVATLGVVWALGTLFLYRTARHSANFVAFVDLLFVGAFIGAVYVLRGITNADCSDWSRRDGQANIGDIVSISTSYWPSLNVNKPCAMLKASFAFGIMNCIFFFFTFILALLVHRHHDSRDRVVVKRETHHYRRGSHSHHSRSPRHSHHSHRSRSYV